RSAGRGFRPGLRPIAVRGRAGARQARRGARPRRAVRRGPGRSLPWLVPAVPAERGEVELLERLLDEPLLIVLVERLARDLLGREDREVGDLVADLLDRAPRLGLDVAPGLLEQ